MIPIAKLREMLGCRLCWRITAGVFLLIFAVESVILMPSARRFQQAEFERISQLAMLAVEPVLASPPGAAASRLSHDLARAVDQGYVAGVAVFRRDRTVFARAGDAERLQFPTELPEDAAGAPVVLSRDDGRLVVAWRSAAQESGVAVASLDARPMREALAAYVWRIAGLIAIIVGVVTAGTMLLLHFAVLRPLLRLRNSNREVSADPDAAERHVVRTRRRDEIGELIEARNGMLTRIAEGIRLVPLTEYADMHTRICRPVGLDPRDRDRIIGRALSRLGDRYDLKNLVDLARYLLPQPPVPARWRRRLLALGGGEPTRAICSTFIARLFQRVRYPILPRLERRPSADAACNACVDEILHIRHHSLFAPRDFDISPYFRIVKPTLEEDFDYHALAWSEAAEEIA